jgi:uncharacterized phage-like protein YoqJ
MNPQTCCFTGHRWLPKEKLGQILKRLDYEVENLINQGVTDFISGGALGFDQIAASLIVAKKEMGRAIRLIFVLPCKNQDGYWRDEQKRLYRGLLTEADEIVYTSEEYFDGCMLKRNRHLADHSQVCICYLAETKGGTVYTVNYARRKGLRIINLA